MVRQAAEGLSADDIGVAAVHQLQHFGSQQPAFAHIVAVADNALGHSLGFLIGGGGAEGSDTESLMQYAFHIF